jgi:hypothetical protein
MFDIHQHIVKMGKYLPEYLFFTISTGLNRPMHPLKLRKQCEQKLRLHGRLPAGNRNSASIRRQKIRIFF